MKTALGNNKIERRYNYWSNYFGLQLQDYSNKYYKLTGYDLNKNGDTTFFVPITCARQCRSKKDPHRWYLWMQIDNYGEQPIYFSQGFYSEITICVKSNQTVNLWMVNTKNQPELTKRFNELLVGDDQIIKLNADDHILIRKTERN